MNIKTEKGKHYTSPQTYGNDEGGLSNFTMINHDVHTKIGVSELDYNKNWNVELRKDVIEEILSIHASLCPEPFLDFIKRGELETSITWREVMLNDVAIDIWRLVFLKNILKARMEISMKTY